MNLAKVIKISTYQKKKIGFAAPIRFVVVDDNDMLLRIWKRIFSTEKNCVFYLTTNPIDALNEMKDKKTDFLITDLVMPRMDGIELAQESQKISPKIQVFLTTGYISNFERIEPWQENSQVLKKPYEDIEKIQSFIHHLINQHSPFEKSYCKKEGEIFVWNL